jgi:GNAT superfamily N-acetyltransferase
MNDDQLSITARRLRRRHVQFGPDYAEDVVLKDGSTARLRLIQPSDKERLGDLLAAMSPRSRGLRFCLARGAFSERELSYLTEVDGMSHFALLAVRGAETLGEARFVRTSQGDAAEPAFALADKAQGMGLGRILVARLADAARERGVRRFEAYVLPHNFAMLRLFHELDGSVPLRPMAVLDELVCTVDLSGDGGNRLSPRDVAI